MPPALAVRPFVEDDYAPMIDYFVGGGDAFLRGMGVDVARVPDREAWLALALADHARSDGEKERFFVAWLADGELVGHSSISHIELGRTAHVHMHLWRVALRGAGLGPELLGRSIDLVFERFALESLACEPYAENPGPNRVLPRLGFRLVRRYRTVPTGIAFEQYVNRWTIGREAWFSGPSSLTDR